MTAVVPEQASGSRSAPTFKFHHRSRWAHRASVWGPLTLLAFLVAAAALPSVFATHDPLSQDLRSALQGPSRNHWLGTDQAGRDVWSRIIFGARITLLAGAYATTVAAVFGVSLGLLSGYVAGTTDRIVMRVIDAVMSLPGLFLAIAVIAVFGGGLMTAMTAIGIVFMPSFARLSRAAALTLRVQGFVEFAKVSGVAHLRILWKHLLPNMAPVLLVQLGLTLALAMLSEAGLSLIGLGLQPPNPSWGGMLSTGANYMARQGWLVVWPGVALSLTILSINLLSDAARRRFLRSSSLVQTEPPSETAKLQPFTMVALTTRMAVVEDNPGDDVVLEVRHLSVAFPGRNAFVPVIEDVSLAVRKGEVVGLVGESGSGKTITALASAGHVPTPGRQTAGRVWVTGKPLDHLSPSELQQLRRAEIGFVFQDPYAFLDPVFTVGNQLDEVLRHGGMSGGRQRRRRAIELLEEVEITRAADRLNDYPSQFSGGMAQRLLIALALANEPCLLIADEPTTALDVSVQQGILDLLHELKDSRGLAVLFVTHDFGVAADVCDRVTVMYGGQVVESASSHEIFTEQRHPYTRSLMGALPRVDATTAPFQIPGQVASPGTWDFGCRFANRCAQVTSECRAAPVALSELTPSWSSRCIQAAQGGFGYVEERVLWAER